MKINEFIPNTGIFEDITIKKEKSGANEGNLENSFFNTLKEQLDEVNEKQIEAGKTSKSFIKGDEVNIHKVMLDSEEAKMSLELAVQVRNKIVEAYQELNRMQL